MFKKTFVISNKRFHSKLTLTASYKLLYLFRSALCNHTQSNERAVQFESDINIFSLAENSYWVAENFPEYFFQKLLKWERDVSCQLVKIGYDFLIPGFHRWYWSEYVSVSHHWRWTHVEGSCRKLANWGKTIQLLTVCLSVLQSVYLSICICLSVNVSICLSVCLSLSVSLSVYRPAWLSDYLSVYLSVFLSVYLFVCLYVCVYVFLSACPLAAFQPVCQTV